MFPTVSLRYVCLGTRLSTDKSARLHDFCHLHTPHFFSQIPTQACHVFFEYCCWLSTAQLILIHSSYSQPDKTDNHVRRHCRSHAIIEGARPPHHQHHSRCPHPKNSTRKTSPKMVRASSSNILTAKKEGHALLYAREPKFPGLQPEAPVLPCRQKALQCVQYGSN